jgi:hypothetical protein
LKEVCAENAWDRKCEVKNGALEIKGALESFFLCASGQIELANAERENRFNRKQQFL